MPTGVKPYPHTAFRFRVEIGGITAALVNEVGGLQIETDLEVYEEGGCNTFAHQLPKRTKYPRLTLKRGITDLDDLWRWYQTVISGDFERKNMAIVLIDATGSDIWRWDISEAYPVKWSGPDFKAESAAVAFESVEFVHEGIRKG